MHRIIRTKAYEAEHGPHFNEEHARKAVSKMENEDGSRGQHWSIEETTALANQHGIRLDDKFNKYDWYVALNMVYSDYYKVIINIANSNSSKFFVELAKAWICDRDVDEGKMWYYYVYVMCDKIRNAEEDYFERHYSKYEDDEEEENYGNYRRMGRSSYGRRREYDREYDERDYEKERMFPYEDELKLCFLSIIHNKHYSRQALLQLQINNIQLIWLNLVTMNIKRKKKLLLGMTRK